MHGTESLGMKMSSTRVDGTSTSRNRKNLIAHAVSGNRASRNLPCHAVQPPRQFSGAHPTFCRIDQHLVRSTPYSSPDTDRDRVEAHPHAHRQSLPQSSQPKTPLGSPHHQHLPARMQECKNRWPNQPGIPQTRDQRPGFSLSPALPRPPPRSSAPSLTVHWPVSPGPDGFQ